MRRKAAAGEVMDVLGDASLEPEEMPQKRWRRAQTIRAQVLRYLLVGSQWPVHEKGVHLRGVRILGQLDLEAATIRCPARLEACFFDGPPPALGFATTSWLKLDGCHLTGLDAESIAVSKDLDLSSSVFTGLVDLEDAEVAGWLICTSAKLHGKDERGNALAADMIKIGGGAGLDNIYTSDSAGAIRLAGAEITGQLNCHGARLNGMDDSGNTLIGDWMKAGRGLILTDARITGGAARFAGADIAGQLNCRRAELDGKDKEGYALVASGMKVRGDALLDRQRPEAGKKADAGKSFVASGAVKLARADIIGKLSLSGAKLKGTDKEKAALFADSVKVGDSVILDDEFTAWGTVRLPGANITRRLVCADAELKGNDSHGSALLADGMKVGGGVSLDSVRTTSGAIRLIGAEITGDLRCDGADLKGADYHGNAMLADRIKVSDNVFIGIRAGPSVIAASAADGALSLRSARIGGSLQLEPEKLADQKGPESCKVALDLAGAQIAHDLLWEPRRPVSGQVILEDAEVGRLKDRWAARPNGYWPSARAGQLRLDGFTYKRICEEGGVTWSQRLEWVGSPRKPAPLSEPPVFTTQPYEQLARVYRRLGKDREARRVAIARRRDLRRYGDVGLLRRVGNWLLDNTIRYGYRTWRALAAMVVLYVAFLSFSVFAQHHNLIVTTQSIKNLKEVPTATRCVKDYPCFYPVGYAIDTVIPIIKVNQADHWGPNRRAHWGWAWVGVTWLAIGLGWALATLLVAGYTGLVRRD